MKRIAIVALVFAAACGGTQVVGSAPDQRDNEITALWTQIRDWRREAHMTLDPTPQDVLLYTPKPVGDAKRVCPENHHVPQTCDDVCNLADDICDNAERICTLAEELGKSDDYAQEKCRSAKASCKEAKQKCCNCSADADAGGSW